MTLSLLFIIASSLAILPAGTDHLAVKGDYDLTSDVRCPVPKNIGQWHQNILIELHSDKQSTSAAVCPDRSIHISTGATVDELRELLALSLQSLNDRVAGPLDYPDELKGFLFAPKQYDHETHKPMRVVYQEVEHIGDACGEPELNGKINGCSISITGGVCMIILPLPHTYGKNYEDALFRHERAHCNGWRHP